MMMKTEGYLWNGFELSLELLTYIVSLPITTKYKYIQKKRATKSDIRRSALDFHLRGEDEIDLYEVSLADCISADCLLNK